MEKLVVFIFAIFLSFVLCSTSHMAPAMAKAVGAGAMPPCFRSLHSCIHFLTSPAGKPISACCIPLIKKAMTDDLACLCELFANQDLMNSLNVTQEKVLGLPSRCGMDPPDLSKCKKSSITLTYLLNDNGGTVGDDVGGARATTDGGLFPPCFLKLMPCRPFLKTTDKPASLCCIQLSDALKGDAKCLCDMFSNEALLKSLGVTQAEMLALPPRCGLKKPDVSKCKKSSSSSSSNETVPKPPASKIRCTEPGCHYFRPPAI